MTRFKKSVFDLYLTIASRKDLTFEDSILIDSVLEHFVLLHLPSKTKKSLFFFFVNDNVLLHLPSFCQ